MTVLVASVLVFLSGAFFWTWPLSLPLHEVGSFLVTFMVVALLFVEYALSLAHYLAQGR